MFLTTAVAFSFAQGIFHPYYVAQLAPFTAALVGAGVGLVPVAPPRRGLSPRPSRWRPGWRPSCSSCTTCPVSSRGCPPSCSSRGAVTAVALVAVRGRAARRRPRRRARAAAARPRELGRADARALDHRGHLPGGRAGAGRLRRRPGSRRPRRRWRPRRLRRSPRRRHGPRRAADRHRRALRRRRERARCRRPGRRPRRRRLRRRQRRADPGRGLRQAARRRRHRRLQPVRRGRRRSSSRARTSPASAASPAARARSPRRGWPTRCAAGACAGC